MPPSWIGVDGEKWGMPSLADPPIEVDDVEDGRFRPSLAPIRLSIPPLAPPLSPRVPPAPAPAGLRIGPLPRVGVVLLNVFFFPPKPTVAEAAAAALVAGWEWPDMGVDGADDDDHPAPPAADAGRSWVRELTVPNVDTLRSPATVLPPSAALLLSSNADGVDMPVPVTALALLMGDSTVSVNGGIDPFSLSSKAVPDGRLCCCC